jgi:natural product precursor
MKPKKLSKKLSLNKMTVANLANPEMDNVKGGDIAYASVPWANKSTCIPCVSDNC